jgi:hypothetical protein
MKRWRMALWVMLLVMAGAGCGSRPESDVLGLADRFFQLLKDGKVDEAYGMLAEDDPQETGVEAFQQRVEALGLNGNRGVVWDPPYIDDDYGTIEGVVTNRDGLELRQELVFFKKDGTWTIHIVREPVDRTALDLIVEARLQQPNPDGMRRLAMGTIRQLAEALQTGDFTAFHRETAPALREHLTPEQLRESFSWLAAPELELDWAAVRDAAPVFDVPPAVDEEGLLTMGGHVPVGERRIGFQLQFAYVTPDWMLMSISVRPPL